MTQKEYTIIHVSHFSHLKWINKKEQYITISSLEKYRLHRKNNLADVSKNLISYRSENFVWTIKIIRTLKLVIKKNVKTFYSIVMNVQAFYIIIFDILAKPFSPSNTENSKMTRLIMISFIKYMHMWTDFSNIHCLSFCRQWKWIDACVPKVNRNYNRCVEWIMKIERQAMVRI